MAWWGPGIRAESGAPGQGPCRRAPSPKDVQGSPARKSKPQSLGLQQLAAAPGLSAEPINAHDALMESPFPHVHEQPNSESASSDSGMSSGTDSEAGPHSDHDSDQSELQPGCSAATEPQSKRTPDNLWVSHCQLSPHEQQRFMHLKQESQDSQGEHTTTARGRVSMLCQSQHDHDTAITLGSSLPHAAGMQQVCQQGPHGFNPATIAPVWLPVDEISCETKQQKQERHCQDSLQSADQLYCLQTDQEGNGQTEQWHHQLEPHQLRQQSHQQAKDQDLQIDRQDDRQDDQQHRQQHNQQHDQQGKHQNDCQLHDHERMQPPLKRSKQDVSHDRRSFVSRLRQQAQLPLPPLHFFLQGDDEISSVTCQEISVSAEPG